MGLPGLRHAASHPSVVTRKCCWRIPAEPVVHRSFAILRIIADAKSAEGVFFDGVEQALDCLAIGSGRHIYRFAEFIGRFPESTDKFNKHLCIK